MNFAVVFTFSFLVSLALSKLVIRFAARLGFLDDPKKRHHPAALHKKAVPRAGGLPIFVAFLVCALIFLPFSKQLFGIVIGGLILIFVGLLDDRYDLKNSYKLVGQIVAALVVVASGIGISFITNPFYLLSGFFTNIQNVILLDDFRIFFNFFGTHSIVVWADLFALFWIVWVINMVNFSAGVDGQLPGISVIALLVIFAASLRFYPQDTNQLIVTQLALIGAGATLGFLFFNFFPAKIFPGDSGSYFLGFLIAVLAILSGAKVGAAMLVMVVPLVDGVFTVIRRILDGKSPFLGDRKHLHHRLLELGLKQSQVALFYWLFCAILGAVALFLSASEKVFAGIIVAIMVLGGLLWLNMNLPTKDQK